MDINHFTRLGILNKFMLQMKNIESNFPGVDINQIDDAKIANWEMAYDILFTIILKRIGLEVRDRFSMQLSTDSSDMTITDDTEILGFNKEEFIEFTDVLIKKNIVAKAIYDSFEISQDEAPDPKDRVKILRPGLVKFFASQVEKSMDQFNNDMTKFKIESSIISICVCLETIAYRILNITYRELPSLKDLDEKTISFSHLRKIETLEGARQFLIESELNKVFRQSFGEWFEEINKRFLISSTFPSSAAMVDEIDELFQRRNLYVHANGIVNNMYLQNCTKDFTKNIEPGEYLESSMEYVRSRWNSVIMIGWFLYYKFCLFMKPHLENAKENAIDLHLDNYILQYLSGQIDAIPLILKDKKDRAKSDYSKLVDQMNYFLYYRINNRFDEIKDEVANFDSTPYAIEFNMFIAILLGDPEAFRLTKQYIDNSTSDNNFFEIYEWPVFRLVRDTEPYKSYFKQRIDDLFS